MNPGWEAYGAIVREAYAELRPVAFIENVRLAYEMTAPYAHAACRARVFLSASQAASASGELAVSFAEGASEGAHAERQVDLVSGTNVIELDLPAPVLWSPHQPNLYSLHASLESGHHQDDWSCPTGFRQVEIRRNQFYLNGTRLVLNGVTTCGRARVLHSRTRKWSRTCG